MTDVLSSMSPRGSVTEEFSNKDVQTTLSISSIIGHDPTAIKHPMLATELIGHLLCCHHGQTRPSAIKYPVITYQHD